MTRPLPLLLLLLLNLVGVGIEPTFRAFQARANPSQLSDPRYCRFSIADFQLLYLSIPEVFQIGNWQSEIGNAVTIMLSARASLSREHLDRHAYP
jgi:hypothetical protein